MKKKELTKVSNNRIGYINTNGVKLESNEETTFQYLTLFGFNIELIRPTSTRKAKNPDVLLKAMQKKYRSKLLKCLIKTGEFAI